MIGHISAALIGRDVARRAGVNGMLGAAIGLAGSIALRRLMPAATAATIDGLVQRSGLGSILGTAGRTLQATATR